MNQNEIVALLALIAAYDQRTVGETDVMAWQAIADTEQWTFPLARRAVIEHHRRGGDRPRIKPGHITDCIDNARVLIRKQVFTRDITPPRELADNPRAELAWRRKHIGAVVERALNAWAQDRPLPALENAPEPEARHHDTENAINLRGMWRMPNEAS